MCCPGGMPRGCSCTGNSSFSLFLFPFFFPFSLSLSLFLPSSLFPLPFPFPFPFLLFPSPSLSPSSSAFPFLSSFPFPLSPSLPSSPFLSLPLSLSPFLSPSPFPCLLSLFSLPFPISAGTVLSPWFPISALSDSFSSRSGGPSDHHYYCVPHHGHSCSDNNSCLKKLVRGLTAGLGWDRLPMERDFTLKLQQALVGPVWCGDA